MPSSSCVASYEAGQHSLSRGGHRRMPPIDLHQRRAVVTGAAKGIGRAIAARLLTAGAAVCLWDRAPEALTSTAHDLRPLGTVEAVTVDVTDPAAVSAAVQAMQERLGGVDILVNNAGIAGPNHPLWEYPLEAWRQVVEVNLLGTRLPPLKRAKDDAAQV